MGMNVSLLVKWAEPPRWHLVPCWAAAGVGQDLVVAVEQLAAYREACLDGMGNSAEDTEGILLALDNMAGVEYGLRVG